MPVGNDRRERHETSTPVKQAVMLGVLVLPLVFWWVRADGGSEASAPEELAATLGSGESAAFHVPPVSSAPGAPSHNGHAPIASDWPAGSAFPQLVRGETAAVLEWKIVSGLTNVQIARDWEQSGFGTAFEFLEALNDPRIAGEFGVPTPLTEGWILSDTYRFEKRTPARTVVRMMLAEFRERTAGLFLEASDAYPDLTETGLLTLASIIEKESRDRVDRRRVSSVYHNRLRRGMRLEADPTLAFALGHPDRRLRNRDRWVQSPHNTYKNGGLPPAPICNISLDCLSAAVHPVETDYLFFVSMGNGRHFYSRTYREHLAAVERYRSRRLANAR